jgi:hypothetical protein
MDGPGQFHLYRKQRAMRLKLMGLVRVVWNEVIVEQLAKGRY